MSYPFRVQFDRRGRGGRSGPGGKERAGWEGVGREGRSGPGRKEWVGGKGVGQGSLKSQNVAQSLNETR